MITDFGSVESAAVTVLVDNRADAMMESSDTIKAFTERPLLAEHGFAALVHIPDSGTRVLWDAGSSETALPENMSRMAIDAATIDVVALSHGHADHTRAVSAVLRAIAPQALPREWPAGTPTEELVRYAAGRRVPIVAHPAAFRERWSRSKDGAWHGPVHAPSRDEWEALGADVILSSEPYRLAAGCWLTGTVPRRSFEQAGVPQNRYYRAGRELLPDSIEDDQSIVIHVRGRGLVVLTGCAHSGIINTIEHAREISGVDRVWAVIGGYHLARAPGADIDRTVVELERLRPQLLVPAHCTGFRAVQRFASQFRAAFDLCAVGKTYLF
jgi:7,8-dihydropterin-6-yl-methyl-4-(beta-D-ribofuranosyl)aminobenzene 5'-phosphate synthase